MIHRSPSFVATVIVILCVAAGSPPAASADPVVPGFSVEVYAPVLAPMRLSFDETGNLFVGNNSDPEDPIMRIGPGGTPIEFHGPALPDPDALIAYDPDHALGLPDGAVLVGGVWDADRGYVVAVLSDGSTQDVWGPTTTFRNPSDFEYDDNGRLLFADWSTSTVFVSAGEFPNPLISTPARPGGLAVDGFGRIFVWCEDQVIRIYDFDGSLVDGSFASEIGGTPGLAFGPGEVWGTDLYLIADEQLLRFDSSGEATVVGTGFSPNGTGPDVTFGADGALYVSDYSMDRILRIEPSTTDAVGAIPGSAPRLHNWPNPFSGTTRIGFSLACPGRSELEIYAVSGTIVRRLSAGSLDAGPHTVSWDGRDETGDRLASGTYFTRLRVGEELGGTHKVQIRR